MQRPYSAAPASQTSSKYGGARTPQRNSSRIMSASGRHVFGPAMNQGPNSRPATAKMDRTLHDPMQYWDTKMDKSAPFYKNTRV